MQVARVELYFIHLVLSAPNRRGHRSYFHRAGGSDRPRLYFGAPSWGLRALAAVMRPSTEAPCTPPPSRSLLVALHPSVDGDCPRSLGCLTTRLRGLVAWNSARQLSTNRRASLNNSIFPYIPLLSRARCRFLCGDRQYVRIPWFTQRPSYRTTVHIIRSDSRPSIVNTLLCNTQMSANHPLLFLPVLTGSLSP